MMQDAMKRLKSGLGALGGGMTSGGGQLNMEQLIKLSLLQQAMQQASSGEPGALTNALPMLLSMSGLGDKLRGLGSSGNGPAPVPISGMTGRPAQMPQQQLPQDGGMGMPQPMGDTIPGQQDAIIKQLMQSGVLQ